MEGQADSQGGHSNVSNSVPDGSRTTSLSEREEGGAAPGAVDLAGLETLSKPWGEYREGVGSKALGWGKIFASYATLPAITSILVAFTYVLDVRSELRGTMGWFNSRSAQYVVWAAIEGSLALIALSVLNFLVKNRGNRGISIRQMDAFYSLATRSVSLSHARFSNVMAFLLPLVVAALANYAVGGLLGRDLKVETGRLSGSQPVTVGPAGGGRPQDYTMTGQEYMYNVSRGCFSRPDTKYAWFDGNVAYIPVIPDIGTHGAGGPRSGRTGMIRAVRAKWNWRHATVWGIDPTSKSAESTVPRVGQVKITQDETKTGGKVELRAILNVGSKYAQHTVTIEYDMVKVDLEFITKGGTGTEFSKLAGVSEVKFSRREFPDRLDGRASLDMGSVLDNVYISQNGRRIVNEFSQSEPPDSQDNSAKTVAVAFAIRSARSGNWLDKSGKVTVETRAQWEVICVPRSYYIVTLLAAAVSWIAALYLIFTRPWLDCRLGQTLAMSAGLEFTPGLCTPAWMQKMTVDSAPYDEALNETLTPGYLSDENGLVKRYVQGYGLKMRDKSFVIGHLTMKGGSKEPEEISGRKMMVGWAARPARGRITRYVNKSAAIGGRRRRSAAGGQAWISEVTEHDMGIERL